MLKSIIKKFLSLVPGRFSLPFIYFNYHKYFVRSGHLRSELRAIGELKIGSRRAIDIGANIGVYSFAFSKEYSNVESFEPNKACTYMLEDLAKSHRGITVHHIGLSDCSENAELYVPLSKKGGSLVGLASVEDPGGERSTMQISLRRLDDYNFTSVDLIKIDVEGHEFEVINGAKETIKREKPLLLVEIEQRHLRRGTVEEVIEFICDLGYEGRFLMEGKLTSIDEFSYEKDQKPYLDDISSKGYINNFIFSPQRNL